MAPELFQNSPSAVAATSLITSRLKLGADAKIPLPGWAAFLVSLGQRVSREAFVLSSASRQVVVITVPNRNFAALLITSGFLTEYYQRLEALDVDQHFQRLSELTVGASLLYSQSAEGPSRIVNYECVTDTPFGSAIRVRDGKNFLSLAKDRSLQLRPIATKRVAKARAPKNVGLDLLDVLLSSDVAAEIKTSSSCDALIVGNKSRNLFEATEGRFSVATATRPVSGVLADILRPRDMTGKHSRSRIEAVAEAESTPGSPAVVVADGQTAMNVLEGRWPSSQHVVVLDRSDFSFESACQRVYVELTRGWKDLPWLTELNVPTGMEVVGYTEKIRKC